MKVFSGSFDTLNHRDTTGHCSKILNFYFILLKSHSMKNLCPSSPFLTDFENYLNSFLNFEKFPQKNIFWLDTMEHFASLLNNPQNTYKTFHVAGSKGKGSTSAFISSILEAANLKTGLYTSPHILSFLERITQNQKFFSPQVYERSAKQLMDCVNSQSDSKFLKDRPVTWFELVTLYSFLCFKNADVDAAVFEVGLGGRLDATNIIKPAVCCIGPIELEHTEFLGDTLEKIAAEKGGIIKENTPVFIAPQQKSVKEVFKQIASQKNAPIFFTDEICRITTSINHLNKNDLTSFGMQTQITSSLFKRPLNAPLHLTGEFQAQNAALASLAVKTAFPEISEEVIEKGLEKACLPARFEILPSPKNAPHIPYIILDGAHTPKSTALTLDTIQKAKINISTLLFACAQDKNSDKMAELFADSRLFKNVFLTVPGSVKKADLSKIENSFKKADFHFSSNSDWNEQIKKAFSFCEQNNEPLLVTGSFYLVAEVKKFLATTEE